MLEIGPNMYDTTVVYSFISARCRLEKKNRRTAAIVYGTAAGNNANISLGKAAPSSCTHHGWICNICCSQSWSGGNYNYNVVMGIQPE